jgi:transposase
LIRTSDDTLSPEDVALGYKQLLEVENAFRTLKTPLEFRPVYHHLEQRIRAHVLLCWLALLLIRIAENQNNETWRNMRRTLERIRAVEIGTEGRIFHPAMLNPEQKQLFQSLNLQEPPKTLSFLNPADLKA